MLKTFVKTKLAMSKLRDDVKGASLIEYSLLIGLISLAVIATILLISGDLGTIWGNAQTATGQAAANGGGA